MTVIKNPRYAATMARSIAASSRIEGQTLSEQQIAVLEEIIVGERVADEVIREIRATYSQRVPHRR